METAKRLSRRTETRVNFIHEQKTPIKNFLSFLVDRLLRAWSKRISSHHVDVCPTPNSLDVFSGNCAPACLRMVLHFKKDPACRGMVNSLNHRYSRNAGPPVCFFRGYCPPDS